jgi:hypothetical protein
MRELKLLSIKEMDNNTKYFAWIDINIHAKNKNNKYYFIVLIRMLKKQSKINNNMSVI